MANESGKKESGDRTMQMFELQMMQGQMEQLQQQRQKMESKKLEIAATTESLKGLQSSEKDLMIPLGSGVFVKGQVKDNKNAIYAIGSGVAATNSIESTIKFLETQAKLAEEAAAEVERQMKQMASRAQGLIAELEKEEQHDHKKESEE